MYRKPNENIVYSNEKSKKNQLDRKFSDIFEILFDPDYYEGTQFGKFFKEINEKGKSTVYVEDPLEDVLKSIIDSDKNIAKYMVGFTGIGKTTLLRNFFGVFDRDVKVTKDSLIIYISFYYANLSFDEPYKSVENEIAKYISRAIKLLVEKDFRIDFNSYDFWAGFYSFVKENKPVMLESDKLVPDFSILQFHKNIDEKKRIINELQQANNENKIEYFSSLLKYVLKENIFIKKVIFVYDDIESKEAVFHRPLIEIARHIQSCFSANTLEEVSIKTIVALRVYTFRSNIDRQMEARREEVEENTIFKNEPVDIQRILQGRFDKIKQIKNKIGNTEYDEAQNQLHQVENTIQVKFGDFIIQLANKNLCHAMLMYHTILTNIRWISRNEQEKDGRFRVTASNYKLTAEEVFRAIACRENEAYIDGKNQFFPNILHNQKENTDLLALYIIRYLKRKKADDLYGEKYVEGNKIIEEIIDVFVSRTDSQIKMEMWESRLYYVLQYLYNSGILLRSIYDIEDVSEKQIERTYKGNYKLYLSPRGKCLYNLFPQNALLLELYRDDIYTDLDNNDKLTKQLNKNDTFKYLIEYCQELFVLERRYIRSAGTVLNQYIDYFGSELMVSPLLEGIVRNINAYYIDKNNEYLELLEIAQLLVLNMKKYIGEIEKEYGVVFCISEYLKKL